MTSSRPIDPRRLDVPAFALAQGRLQGDWPLAEMGRLLQDALPLTRDSPAQAVAWSAQGERRAVAAGEAEIRLRLQAQTALSLVCQRCLQPMTATLDVRPTIRFVHGADLAQQLDEEGEEDVLDSSAALDLRDLIEDELILALPLVPRHELCPQPLAQADHGADGHDIEARAHPFAALASLRREGGKGS
jgi:uncharacterized protein